MESIGTDYFRPLPAETASIGNGQEAASIGNGQEAESSDNGQEAASTGNGQVVVDVGIGWNEAKQKLCGDVRFEEAEPLVSAITPVPGGVGAVTTAVLALHTVEAALRSLKIKA
ncbi:MAG: bifunctional 5,10-methylenetetrahydrofolate dehydrogenase/5,10-methenyltetrahydrofolate cyclohydrolase [Stomatobaculum sp.]|nr:bifunctional 5,10-methylenetetrahydrofolate dehydrogenase/5,10-methenyltetrahydrofolate cyclohydrolase [Stomatobaculum sp.]